jgi:hypothetical protein
MLSESEFESSEIGGNLDVLQSVPENRPLKMNKGINN